MARISKVSVAASKVAKIRKDLVDVLDEYDSDIWVNLMVSQLQAGNGWRESSRHLAIRYQESN